jgi:polar amino acid transport system substrate-binding protein
VKPCPLVLAAALTLLPLFSGAAGARPLETVRRIGSLSVCANPTALPYSNRYDGPPGFQVEIAQALAREMNLGLTVDWIWERRSARKVDCDVLMDTIVVGSVNAFDREGHTGPAVKAAVPGVELTKPYTRGGVVMVVPAASTARRFEDLGKDVKVGVIVGSVAHQLVDRKGLRVSVFAFQEDIVDAVAKGEVGAGAVAAPYVGWYVRQHPGATVKVPEGYEPEQELAWNVAVGLRRADDALVAAVNGALDRLVESRAIADIYAKYGIAWQPPLGPRAAER